jgi:hypothetical protein
MVRVRIVLLLAAITLVSQATAQQQRPPNSTKLRATLKAQMLDQLKDPDSAKITGDALYVGEDGTTVSLCGEVNARTAMGGYAGRTGFISTTGNLVVFQDSPGSADFGAVWRVWCVKRM